MYLRKQQTMGGFSDYLDALKETALDYANAIKGAVVNAAEWVGDKARAEVKNFRSRKASLDAMYAKLQNSPPPRSAPAAQWAEYNELMTQFGKASAAAETVNDKIRGIEAQYGALSGFGALPVAVVPATVVTAMVAAAYLISKAMDVGQRYFERNSFIQARAGVGVPADQAMMEYDKANQNDKKGLFGDAAELVWPIAIAAVAVVLLKDSGRR